MIINIRGTNGSGKTTLARRFILDNAQTVLLVSYPWPSTKEPDRLKDVTGQLSEIPGLGTVCVVGSYAQAQGGLDTIPSFAIQFAAIKAAADIADHVICEGILASTVAGSWVEFFADAMVLADQQVAVCYLDPPLEVCLQRIRERQERAGKVREIKANLVEAKIKAINATNRRFRERGIPTYLLPHVGGVDAAEKLLHEIMEG